MKRSTLILLPLLAGIILAQGQGTGGMMTGGMMTGGMMTGGMSGGEPLAEQQVSSGSELTNRSQATTLDESMTGGMMTGGMMTGGMMTGGAAVNQPLTVTLSGAQQVPPVATEATGNATVSLDGDTMTLTGDFSGLSSPVFEIAGTPAHIHMAPAGENGDVIFPLNVSVDEGGTSGIFSLSTTLTPEQIDAFNAGDFYINVHTEMHQSGEIRGQITPGM